MGLSTNHSLGNSAERQNPEPEAQGRPNTPNFKQMPLSDILPLNLTIRELVDFDLIGRFMASHNGSRYVQHIMHSINGQSDELELLSVLLFPNALELSTTRYGCRVVQFVATKMPAFGERLICDAFRQQNLHRLATDKYGSNVLEKFVKLATTEQRARLIQILKAKRCSLFKQLAWDEFGNYVIGTLLECSDNIQRQELIRIIRECVVNLRHGRGPAHGYGYATGLVAKVRAIRRMSSPRMRNLNQRRSEEPQTL